jgi:LmbE family N-acetylglucosaminyl deacetylase
MFPFARFVLVFACFLPCVDAQDLVDLDDGSVGAYFALKQLRTTGSVLHIVAHPDDEDGAFLAYCARGLGVRTMLFSITRGEGGANLISNHFFDELGVLRTLEHQKAASYYGNELFYSRAADYGYSKTLDEAMRQWGNGLPILADLVEVIRREKPTILVSRFRGDPRDGHGHHQMAGALSRIAFDAAADPTRFPEQLENGLTAWQAKKLFVGQRFSEPNATTDSRIVAVPTGTYDPLIGRSYAQIARFGLGFQRSQGISGHDGDPGQRTSYYLLTKPAGADDPSDRDASLFGNIDTSFSGLIGAATDDPLVSAKRALADIDRGVEAIWDDWQARAPHRSVPAIARQLDRLREVNFVSEQSANSSDFQHIKQQIDRADRGFQEAIAKSAGLRLDCWAAHEHGSSLNFATPGSTIQVYARIANQNPALDAKLVALRTQQANEIGTPASETIQPGSVFETQFPVTLTDTEANRPYWHRESIREPLYEVSGDGGQRPTATPPLTATATLVVEGTQIELTSVVQTRWRHPEFGLVTYPLTVVPALSIQFPLAESVLPVSKSSYTVPIVVRSHQREPVNGTARLELPEGWSSVPVAAEVAFQRDGEEATVSFEVHPAEDASGEHTIGAVVSVDGQPFREGFQTVSARDLGRMNVFRPAVHRVRIADIRLEGEPRIGYITGSGDRVAESLSALDLQTQRLTASDLAGADLAAFDLILVGVRAYAVRDDVRKYNARLMDYVKNGGVLVVQYQTPEFDANFGPYPYEMGRRPEEVSEEDATVKILQPDHVLFRVPNKITQAEFDGWIEQRGSKFWSTWDDKYVPLLECHDTGQSQQRGGMMFTRYGKGVYVYSAYAWYRQLPNGVPGAYRLFANLLSLPKTKDR